MSMTPTEQSELAGRDAGPLAGRFDEVSYEPPAGLTFSRWQEIGSTLQQMYRSTGWWLGDWYNAGERLFGEAAAQGLADWAGLELSSIKNYAWVARRFPPERRRKDLSFGHHYSVAALSYEQPKVADQMLRQAAEAGWTRKELRAQAREVERIARPPRSAAQAKPPDLAPPTLALAKHCPTCTCLAPVTPS